MTTSRKGGKRGNGTLTVLALAVPGVVAGGIARADEADEALRKLTVPESAVEVGIIDVSKSSAKFGEYSGLHKSGTYLNGNLDLRGGDPNSGLRWSVTGADLGLSSRSLGAAVRDQGRWFLGFNYDELKRYTSDSYQTPFQGAMGGNAFTLPAGFGLTAAAAPGTRGMTAAQLAAFHTVEVSNTRENLSLNGGYYLNQNVDIRIDYNRLEQSGAKLSSVGAAGWGGATGERISLLPMPTNYKTDTVNAALNWTGDKGHATASYYGSFFRDAYSSMTWQTWAGANVTQQLAMAPSNNFNQFGLTGGYTLLPRTKIAGGFSYARNTQNVPYAYDSGLAGANLGPMTLPSPTNSLNGSVRTTHADLKVTDQTLRNLTLTAGFKYDDRDNRTASNIYSARAIDGSTNNRYDYPNAPYSIKKTQFELAGDYRFDARQKLRASYVHEDTDRKCNQYATGGGVIAAGTFPYLPGTNCVSGTNTKEDKTGLTYRLKATEDLSFNAGYQYSHRRTQFDDNARGPFISTDGSVPGFTTPGINVGDYRGFHAFFLASRRQDLLKGGANWQATERLSFAANARYANDDYTQALGVQKGKQWSANLDGNFAYAEKGSVFAYVSQQQRTRDVTDQQGAATATATRILVPAGGTWTNKLHDSDTTLGLGFKQGGLMGGRIELMGDLSHSFGKTRYETFLNYQTTDLGGRNCADPAYLSCGLLPDIVTRMTQLKLNGTYDLDKKSKVSVLYLYRRLRNDDFYYNGLQTGFTPQGVMPTNQQAPNYSVTLIGASYIHKFE